MSRGTILQAGGQDCYVIPFCITNAAATTAVTTIASTFTRLQTVLNMADDEPVWTAPWPCRIVEVYTELRSSVVGDGAKIAVRTASAQSAAPGPAETTTDVIRNAYGGSAVNYIVCVAAAANTMANVRYTGELQDTSVASNPTGVVGTETATGFYDANADLAAGDNIYCLYALKAAEDTFSHLKVFITVAKTEAS